MLIIDQYGAEERRLKYFFFNEKVEDVMTRHLRLSKYFSVSAIYISGTVGCNHKMNGTRHHVICF